MSDKLYKLANPRPGIEDAYIRIYKQWSYSPEYIMLTVYVKGCETMCLLRQDAELWSLERVKELYRVTCQPTHICNKPVFDEPVWKEEK